MKRLIIFCLAIGVISLFACSESTDPYQAYEMGDYESAKEQLKPLADEGDLKATTHLAAIYQMGRNYEEAIKLYPFAARRNYAPAQYNLGILIHNGTGIEKNISKAYSWFFLATEQGHSKANEQLKRMNIEIMPNQIIQAKAWAREQIIKL